MYIVNHSLNYIIKLGKGSLEKDDTTGVISEFDVKTDAVKSIA